jgi:hypothetical protein
VTARIQTEARDYVIFAMKILIHSLADYVYVLCNPPIVLDLAVWHTRDLFCLQVFMPISGECNQCYICIYI